MSDSFVSDAQANNKVNETQLNAEPNVMPLGESLSVAVPFPSRESTPSFQSCSSDDASPKPKNAEGICAIEDALKNVGVSSAMRFRPKGKITLPTDTKPPKPTR